MSLRYGADLDCSQFVYIRFSQGLILRLFLGKKFTGSISAVSVLRAGETLEQAVIEVVKDAKIGKLLIQTNPETLNPELYYLRLPKDIKNDHVLLLDSAVTTGAAVMMAIRILLDHEVQEDRIIVVTLVVSRRGNQFLFRPYFQIGKES